MTSAEEFQRDVRDRKLRMASLHWCPREVSLGHYLKNMARLRDVAAACGAKMQITSHQSMCIVEKPESSYDPLAGTPFQSKTTEREPAEGVMYIRKDAYACIEKCVRPERWESIREAFETRFPYRVWGENLPVAAIQQIVIAEHLDDLLSS